MQKLNLVSNLIKSKCLLHNPYKSLPPLVRFAPRSFSTETEDQAASVTEDQASSTTEAQASSATVDAFLRPPPRGLIYGRISGAGKFTLKTDVLHFLEGCNLSPEDIKVAYTRAYEPFGWIVQFPSRSSFDNASKLIVRKGRLYRLEKVDRGQWDTLTSYDGKVVLLQGISRIALPEDVERFLSGCDYDASSMQIFIRPGFPEPSRMALVHFTSQTAAATAISTKNRGFCLNSQIFMRLLQ